MDGTIIHTEHIWRKISIQVLKEQCGITELTEQHEEFLRSLSGMGLENASTSMKRTLIAQIGIMLVLTMLGGCFGGSVASTPTPQTPQTRVRETLDNMVDAYSSKNIRGFMALVSDSYTGDSSVLDSAVLRDFSAATNITLRYTFNNVTTDGKGKASAALTFTRNYTDIKTGKQITNQGQTTMIFQIVGGSCLLYTQNQPQLFGFK